MPDEIWTLKEFIQESSLGILHRRCNINLIYIDRLLSEYHSTPKDSVETEANTLLLICDACQIYIGRKPTGHRGAAVLTLYTQAVSRVKILTVQQITGHNLGYGHLTKEWAIVKAAIKPLLAGVAGSKGNAHHLLKSEYWPEMALENHFPLSRPISFNLSPILVWKRSDTPLPFIDWLRQNYIPQMIDEQRGEMLWQRLSQGVAYLDSAQREDKKIYVQDGLIYNSRHEIFDTGNMETNSMGRGWAIFVMAPDNTLYANTHKTNVFHHSSFLSGGAVQSAGEIAVDNGRVVAITCKSGHYSPDKGSFVRVLYWLRQHGLNLQHIAACPEPTKQALKFYRAEEVWLKGGQPGTEYIEPPNVLPK